MPYPAENYEGRPQPGTSFSQRRAEMDQIRFVAIRNMAYLHYTTQPDPNQPPKPLMTYNDSLALDRDEVKKIVLQFELQNGLIQSDGTEVEYFSATAQPQGAPMSAPGYPTAPQQPGYPPAPGPGPAYHQQPQQPGYQQPQGAPPPPSPAAATAAAGYPPQGAPPQQYQPPPGAPPPGPTQGGPPPGPIAGEPPPAPKGRKRASPQGGAGVAPPPGAPPPAPQPGYQAPQQMLPMGPPPGGPQGYQGPSMGPGPGPGGGVAGLPPPQAQQVASSPGVPSFDPTPILQAIDRIGGGLSGTSKVVDSLQAQVAELRTLLLGILMVQQWGISTDAGQVLANWLKQSQFDPGQATVHDFVKLLVSRIPR